ncbi:L-amino acid N-acyltransferase YncA [Pseudomonas sp. URMO17WK12:I10]|uniref:GNAT family N-acetyltransferase n=1 Tax=Pseudomonas TaxID=286 RepID=UPI00048812FF|nr:MULTISPECIES: GNAT family N-acetyltransferase [Pseudomonas]MDP9664081.1 GNAT superfamily N-acetyltransferase [Pseudomonas cremoricolorata]AVF55658.1 N-acetyltransferase [Pseudomonas fulva]MDH0618695.1 GNAT family N-acetyltransferase [Pseudomonas fulva]PYB88271.1 GNAT family N-acetyltransferase [Pseudomonas fulva]PYC17086.1 GNAT family N-acetyltransferase [Pseudomonas fulva]
MSLVIRPALRTDAQQILDFITELAEYERAREEVLATTQDIERSLFDADSTVHCLMAEREGRAIGFAIYFYSYSTWLGRNGIYLEDLYISPSDRGDGAGRQLLRYIAKQAVAKGCGRLEWSVLDWNEPAIGFYDALGAQPQTEWLRYRLDGERLIAFAQQ